MTEAEIGIPCAEKRILWRKQTEVRVRPGKRAE
jgi:hypothetical protein